MALLASQYQDDDERGRKIGIALGGLAMGVLGKTSICDICRKLSHYVMLNVLRQIYSLFVLMRKCDGFLQPNLLPNDSDVHDVILRCVIQHPIHDEYLYFQTAS